MPSRPRFALCTAISPSHQNKHSSQARLPRATQEREALFADRPSQFALTAIATLLLSIPTQPRRFETRAPPTCSAALLVTRNTQSTSPSCRTAAAADQTSPNQSINRITGPSHLLPSPSRLRHPRLREWLDFPLPRSARPGSLHNHPVLQRKAHRAAATTARTHSHTYPLLHHCAAFTYANTLTHVVC